MRDITLFLAGLFLGLVIGNMSSRVAFGHEAPTGWTYDLFCCGNQDCSQAPPGAVEFVPSGWLVKETGEVIPLGDQRIHQSKDAHFHVCITTHHINYAGKPHVICLYAPPAEF